MLGFSTCLFLRYHACKQQNAKLVLLKDYITVVTQGQRVGEAGREKEGKSLYLQNCVMKND